MNPGAKRGAYPPPDILLLQGASVGVLHVFLDKGLVEGSLESAAVLVIVPFSPGERLDVERDISEPEHAPDEAELLRLYWQLPGLTKGTSCFASRATSLPPEKSPQSSTDPNTNPEPGLGATGREGVHVGLQPQVGLTLHPELRDVL
jgi:hypothetical protein